MTGSERTLARVEMERMRTRWNLRRGAGGLFPVVVALALWVWVLAGVLAPLGGALARIDAGRRPPGAPLGSGAAVTTR